MARYDYGCTAAGCKGTVELERSIANRNEPVACPRCNAPAALMFTPTTFIGVPQSFATRWSDVAPLDANGRAMSFTETVRSGKYDRYRREDREEAEKAIAATEARVEPERRKRALKRAHKKLSAKNKVRIS